MILDGKVAGLPLVEYVGTKSDIEALTSGSAGMVAYATDTQSLGLYNGSAWRWLGVLSSGSLVMGGNILTVPATGTTALLDKSGGEVFLTQQSFGYGTGGDVPSDGLAIKPYQPSVAGRSTVILSGTNSSVWTSGLGIEFNNHVASINVLAPTKFSSPIAINQLWAGASDTFAVDDMLFIGATGSKVYLTSAKYAGSPYPDVILSAPSLEIKTKTGTGWADGAIGGDSYFQDYGTTRVKILGNGNVGIGTALPTSVCYINGSFATSVTVVSSPVTLDETHQVIIVSNNSSVTLPTAVGISGRQYNIIRSGTSDVTVNTTLSQTISGDLILTLTNQWDSVVVVSDNANWVRCS
jgi:hypothetical protein